MHGESFRTATLGIAGLIAKSVECRLRTLIAGLVVLTVGGATLAAESPRQAFVKAWTGRTVVVRIPLYSLIYNERAKLGNTRSGRRESVVVATPSDGMFSSTAARGATMWWSAVCRK